LELPMSYTLIFLLKEGMLLVQNLTKCPRHYFGGSVHRKLGRVFKSRCGGDYVYYIHLKLKTLKLKTRPKQLFGYISS